MSNAMYTLGRQAFVAGDVDYDANNFRFVLIDGADYTKNLATDDALDDIPGGARVAISANITGKTNTGGTMDCDNQTFSSVTGDQFEQVGFYKETGTEATSLLILNLDTATGLPATPNGGDIILVIDNGADKLATI